jgi:ATP-dependent RNA helicase DDX24/MAK5
MIENYEHECLLDINKIKYFVVDEADRMVELGHFKELDSIIDKIYNKGEIG